MASIGNSAFYECTGLLNIKIPNSVKTIGESAFYRCLKLNNVEFGNSVTEIGDYAFSYCEKLTTVTLPDSVSDINRAFNRCSNLISLDLGGVSSLKYRALWGCSKLSDIVIGSNCVRVGSNAFEDCESLINVYYRGTTEQWNKVTINDGNFYLTERATVHFIHKCQWDEGVVTKKPSCSAPGVKTHTCTSLGCGKTYTETISALGHKTVTDKAVPATCTKGGKTAGVHCSVCGKILTAQKAVPATGHKNKTAVEKATVSKNGKAVISCAVCGKVSKTAVIYKASSVKLAKTAYTYNGKAQKPKVTVKDGKGKILTEGKDYTVKYQSGRKNPGQYTVTVTFKGNYSGKKTLTFTIAPKAPTLKVKANTKKATLSWNKQTGSTGYYVYMATSKNGKYTKIATVKGNKTGYTKTGLKTGKTYYFKVVAYTKAGGKTINSAYSSVKNAKIK